MKIIKISLLLFLSALLVKGDEPPTSFECSYNEKEDVVIYREYYLVKGEKTYHGLTMIIRNSKRAIGSTVRVSKEIYNRGKLMSSSDASSTVISRELEGGVGKQNGK